MSTTSRRTIAAVASLVVLLTLLAGCGDDGGDDRAAEGPRELTTAEAQRFASTRVRAYQAGVRSVQGTVIDDEVTVFLDGWVNTVDHTGFALATPRGATSSAAFLTRWDVSQVSAQPFVGGAPPERAPTDGWEHVTLDPKSSTLAAAQVLLVSLSATQPENPVLLRQNGARWLRADAVGDVAVDVISGPVDGDAESGLRYWLDAQGTLLRLEARLDGRNWSTFTFADDPGAVFG